MSIDAYLAGLPPLRLERVAQFRGLVRQVAPDIVEGIEWKMPVFRRGDHWVAVASQKSCLSVYLGTREIAAAVIASDPGLRGGKTCVNIPDRVEMPMAALEPAIRDALSV